MAHDAKTTIALPEIAGLNSLTTDGKPELRLLTSKDGRGGLSSTASVVSVRDGMITFCLGKDWYKTIFRSDKRGTQKAIDTQHVHVFTLERIEQIKAEVIAYYKAMWAKQSQERARQDTANGLGAAVAELTDAGIDASTALRMCNAD